VKTIPLTQGKEAVVDDQDYENLKQWKWSFTPNGPARHDSSLVVAKTVFMRRVIAQQKGLPVDWNHVAISLDDDKLNCTRANIDSITRSCLRRMVVRKPSVPREVGVKVIPLNRGNAIVDVRDYKHLMQWKWYYTKSGPKRSDKSLECNCTIAMGRVVAKRNHKIVNWNRVILYKDGNELNNTRANIDSAPRTRLRNPKAKAWKCRRGKWKGKTVLCNS
jgi:hypothetical protein